MCADLHQKVMEQLEREWFELTRLAEVTRVALAGAGGSCQVNQKATLAAVLDDAELQKGRVIHQIEALEDSLLADSDAEDEETLRRRAQVDQQVDDVRSTVRADDQSRSAKLPRMRVGLLTA
jgi:hypothetical protein